MKVLLHYSTELGGCTVVVEIADAERAKAIMRAHQHLGELAHVAEEVPRHSLKEHLRKHKQNQQLQAARAAKKTQRDENIVDISTAARNEQKRQR